MDRPLVARRPWRPRARLNLAPRLHAEETLSSWLERFAAAYGMTLRELFLWLGYPDLARAAYQALDLDVSPPGDLARVLAPHAGIPARWIATHRLDGRGALAPYLRRAFCAECWAEEGPCRRIEWAQGWSLICRRHRRLLSERPPPARRIPWSEESWCEFYRDTRAWRDLTPSWQSAGWRRICAALGVEPQAEFVRARGWLLELAQVAQLTGIARRSSCRREHSPLSWRLKDRRVEEFTVKQDLALYGTIRFWNLQLLRALDRTIADAQLMEDTSGGGLCDVRTPQASYWIRLFAATVARHLWVRMTRGEWRCGRHEVIERIVQYPRRWNDEDWWLEQRLRTWPYALAAAGRRLFRRESPFVMLPPWHRCRECLHGIEGAVRAAREISLPETWRCRERMFRALTSPQPF